MNIASLIECAFFYLPLHVVVVNSKIDLFLEINLNTCLLMTYDGIIFCFTQMVDGPGYI